MQVPRSHGTRTACASRPSTSSTPSSAASPRSLISCGRRGRTSPACRRWTSGALAAASPTSRPGWERRWAWPPVSRRRSRWRGARTAMRSSRPPSCCAESRSRRARCRFQGSGPWARSRARRRAGRVRRALRPASAGAAGAGRCAARRGGRSPPDRRAGRPQRGPRRSGRAQAARRRLSRRLGRMRRAGVGHRPVGPPPGPHRPGAARPRPAARPFGASSFHRRERPRAGAGGAVIRFVLHRPRSSQNIGASARALANTGAGALWVVEPLGFDRTQAAKLAAGADHVLEGMRVVRTLEEAVEECVDVVMTTGRPLPGALYPRATARRLLEAPGEAALVFGDEVNGLTNRELRRASAVATIPTAQKSSLNLAQAVLVFGYEVLLARATATPPQDAETPLADEKLLAMLRKRAGELLSRVGFLN